MQYHHMFITDHCMIIINHEGIRNLLFLHALHRLCYSPCIWCLVSCFGNLYSWKHLKSGKNTCHIEKVNLSYHLSFVQLPSHIYTIQSIPDTFLLTKHITCIIYLVLGIRSHFYKKHFNNYRYSLSLSLKTLVLSIQW